MLKPRWTGNVLDRRHGPLPLLAVPSASRLSNFVFEFVYCKGKPQS